ncbi:MAG: hypothetical protein AAF823_08060 [Planctomycetota bacterium]
MQSRHPMLVALLAIAIHAGLASGQPSISFDDFINRAADLHGFDQWDQVERLQWTFHVELPNGRTVDRSWNWHPKTGEVTRTLDGESIAYDRDDLADAADEVIAADRQFINDSFWLIPLWHISRGDPELQLANADAWPIDSDARLFGLSPIARYGPEGGYTPGDSYQLFFSLNDDPERFMRLSLWLFRRGDQGPGRPATFEQYVRLGPLLIATEHRGPEGSGFRLWFEDLEITLANGQTLGPVPAE